MSKATRLAAALVSSRSEREKSGLRMSDVENVTLNALEDNPFNAMFPKESETHLRQLREDIAERGILTPLHAVPTERKRDGTPIRGRLIAGHNRLAIARELELKTVPVQWIDEELTEEQEKHAVIKDNLLRRHLHLDDRMHLYTTLYGESFSTLLREQGHAGRKAAGEESLIIRIAEDTGQAREAVKKQIQRARKKTETADKQKNGDNVPIEDVLKKIRQCLAIMDAAEGEYQDVLRLLHKAESALEKRLN